MSMLEHYILDSKGNPVPVDLMTWATWSEDRKNTVIKQEDIGNYFVSTIFVGLDHSFESYKEGDVMHKPLLFETVIMKRAGFESLDYMERCTTRRQAIAQHKRAINYLRKEGLI